jgi:hypothetical protein
VLSLRIHLLNTLGGPLNLWTSRWTAKCIREVSGEAEDQQQSAAPDPFIARTYVVRLNELDRSQIFGSFIPGSTCFDVDIQFRHCKILFHLAFMMFHPSDLSELEIGSENR